MKERLITFLQSENKSYAQFAEEIGVQPSGISHILSGRNNPSLDFVIKMLTRYPSISAEWLLFGRGPVYKMPAQPTLFDSSPEIQSVEKGQSLISGDKSMSSHYNYQSGGSDDTIKKSGRPEVALQSQSLTAQTENESGEKKISRVILFYSDNTFSEYRPF